MRKTRNLTQSRLYHVIIRGVNKQDIFIDDQDKGKFKKELKRTKEKFQYLLYAYVIMPNHAHLVIYDKNNNLSSIMHSILVSYSEYINKKYEREGHLFQDRFRSKSINDDEYLKNVVMYIHYNPEKAGIARFNEYRWSSYNEYVGKDNYGLVDRGYIINLNKYAIAELEKQHQLYKEDRLAKIKNRIEFELEYKVKDEELIEWFKVELGLKSIYDLQKYNYESLRKILEPIFKELKVSAFQISRITGIPKAIIYKIKESKV